MCVRSQKSGPRALTPLFGSTGMAPKLKMLLPSTDDLFLDGLRDGIGPEELPPVGQPLGGNHFEAA